MTPCELCGQPLSWQEEALCSSNREKWSAGSTEAARRLDNFYLGREGYYVPAQVRMLCQSCCSKLMASECEECKKQMSDREVKRAHNNREEWIKATPTAHYLLAGDFDYRPFHIKQLCDRCLVGHYEAERWKRERWESAGYGEQIVDTLTGKRPQGAGCALLGIVLGLSLAGFLVLYS